MTSQPVGQSLCSPTQGPATAIMCIPEFPLKFVIILLLKGWCQWGITDPSWASVWGAHCTEKKDRNAVHTWSSCTYHALLLSYIDEEEGFSLHLPQMIIS